MLVYLDYQGFSQSKRLMQIRQSGMPDEAYWESLLNVGGILDAFNIGSSVKNVVELGCGYGTFTIAVARRIAGTIHTYEVDEDMVARTNARAAACELRNVVCEIRDVAEQGFMKPDLPSIDVCLLFNILHAENPVHLINSAGDVLRRGGRLAVIHWRYDEATPRGPTMDIRPRPEQITKWVSEAGGLAWDGRLIDLPPWHYGLEFTKVL